MIKGACPVGWAGWPPDPQPDKADISERRITRGRIGAVEAVRTSCANKRTLHYEQLHFQYMSGSPEGCHFFVISETHTSHEPITEAHEKRDFGSGSGCTVAKLLKTGLQGRFRKSTLARQIELRPW
jgi:hypothetical protein